MWTLKRLIINNSVRFLSIKGHLPKVMNKVIQKKYLPIMISTQNGINTFINSDSEGELI